jgi:mRNA (guanine-N7-)-methyltransferase
VYYNRQEKDSRETQGLRDFHNLFVKRFLLEKLAKYLQEKVHIGNVLLMDYAVGKAGDLSKWIRAGISFVLGIDISKDNIVNAKDGACVRYLNTRKQHKDVRIRALFLHGNSGKNILTTQKAFYTNQEKEALKAVFGHGSAKEKPIAREYMGIARDGFHISSCQFAMHYFFASPDTLHSFLRNLSECTKLGGYFTGTCYNGQRVFDLLRNKLQGESVRFDKNGKKIFELTKGYANTIEAFPSGPESIGMAIQVYQESIDKTFEEYLVNFVFFERLMEDYGFVSLTESENQTIGIAHSNGSFEQLYRNMENIHRDRRSDYGQAFTMTKEEKTISFLNLYFIFKKARNVTAERLQKLHEKYVTKIEEEEEEEDIALISSKSGKRSFLRKIPDKKISLSLSHYSPIKEEPVLLEEEKEEEEKEEEEKGEEEKEKVEDFGEYTEFFENLKPDVQEKIRKYPKEKQLEILRKLQKPNKKVVTKK